jgi:hypothetical protein
LRPRKRAGERVMMIMPRKVVGGRGGGSRELRIAMLRNVEGESGVGAWSSVLLFFFFYFFEKHPFPRKTVNN